MPALLYKFQGQELRFQLKDPTTIGRGRDNDLCVPSESISGLHAVLTRDGEGYQLEDAGSSNGIVVDGRRVLSCLLRDGSAFALGDVEFIFTEDGGEAAGSEGAAEAPGPVPTETGQSGEAGRAGLCPPNESGETLIAQPMADGGQSRLAGSPTIPEAPATEALSAPPASEPVPFPAPIPAPTAMTPPPPTGMPKAAPSAAPTQEVIARFEKARDQVLGEIGKVIVGQREVLNQMLVALFARGHCLLIGVPGLAKTLMVRTLGSALDLDSRRIQFTPDLMPSDITGTDILEEDSADGPARLPLPSRADFHQPAAGRRNQPHAAQDAGGLLEAMQEQRVTISGTSYDLPSPFMVLATQNPIEQEGPIRCRRRNWTGSCFAFIWAIPARRRSSR
jgi:hypothetical protein